MAERRRASEAGRRDRTAEPRDNTTDPPRYVGPARSFVELLAAYRLVYECYLEEGYCEPNPGAARVSIYNLLPGTTTFVSVRGDRIVGTVSVALDSPHGLPLAEVFPERMLNLRERGRRVAEAIMLSHKPEAAKRSGLVEFEQLLRLMRCVTDYARLHEVDDLCIITNPHHVDFYRRRLAFEVIDGPRPCPSVRGAPAVLLRHDMHTIKARSEALVPRASRFFLSGDPDPAVLGGYRLQGEDVLILLTLEPRLWRRTACPVSIFGTAPHWQADVAFRTQPALGPLPLFPGHPGTAAGPDVREAVA